LNHPHDRARKRAWFVKRGHVEKAAKAQSDNFKVKSLFDKYTGNVAALATLAAAGTSFAQSSVTISGLLDVSAAKVGGDGLTVSQNGIFVNASRGSATSAINFNIVEDLGGGLRAQAFYAIDPRLNINDPASGIGRHEAFVGLTGGFGQIRLGSVNTASLSVLGASGPFGTATGSGFAEIHTAAGGNVRFANSVRYDAPTFVKGLAFNVTYAPGNKDMTAGTTAVAGGATNAPQATDLGLAYTNGPLQLSLSSLSRSAYAAQTAVAPATQVGGAGGNALTPAGVKSTVNAIAANYTIGALRLMGGVTRGDLATGADIEGARIGATYTMGAVALHVQQATLQIGSAAKRTATGVRADYALSKRSTAYVGYEAYDNGSAIAAGLGDNRKTAMVGVRHNF
jgi:predicted porin